MKKPDSCIGCPLFGDGFGYVPDEIIPGAPVDCWLQNPGATEEAKAFPACGATGDDLNDTFLPAAGLERGKDVSVRNVLRCRLISNGKKVNDLPRGKDLAAAVKHCRVHDAATRATLSVAAGSLAWKMFDGPGSVTDWRGFLHPTKPVLCTLHPADLFRNPAMKLPVLHDWGRVEAIRNGTWPEAVPPFEVLDKAGDAAKLDVWVRSAIHAPPPFIVVDTEYTRDTRYLLTLGLGAPGMAGVQVWFRDLTSVDRSIIRTALKTLFAKVPVVFQNAMADIPVLERNMGIMYTDYLRVEDTMLAHAVLWSEWPHDLGYLASLYGRYPKMKHLSSVDAKLYNWGDVVDTISVWQGVSQELVRDRASRTVYEEQSLPLVPILLRRARRGIRVDKTAVGKAIEDLELRRDWASGAAAAVVGRPFKLGSEKQLKAFFYQERGYPVQKDKHKKVSIGGDAVAKLRQHVGPAPDLDWEAKEGLDVPTALQRIEEGADPVLEARVLYADAKQELTHFLGPLRGADRIYPSIKIHAQASGRWSITDPPLQQFPSYLQGLLIPDKGEVWIGWDWDAIEMRLLAGLANDRPYIKAFEQDWDVHSINVQDIFWGQSQEARLKYAEGMLGLPAGVFSTAVSTGDCALVQQLVSQFEAGVDGALDRSGLISGAQETWRARLRAPHGSESWPGRGCTSPQWKQTGQSPIESSENAAQRARVFACAAWIVCGGPPPGWEGGEDIRRTFAKRFVYRLNYGGDPRTAGDIPGAKQLGLTGPKLVEASRRYLAAHPAMAAWRVQAAAGAQTTHVSRSFMGRRRRLLGDGRSAVREAFNHPMQAGCADILNLTTIEIARKLPYACLVYTVHDSAWWAVPEQHEAEATQVIAETISRNWNVGGVDVYFPAKLKPVRR